MRHDVVEAILHREVTRIEQAAAHLRVEGRGVTLRTYRGVNFCKFGGGPNGIRAVVGLDLTFSIRGVAIRQQGDELGPTPPLA